MWRRSTSCQLNGSSVKLRSPKAARWIILLAASYELAARSKRQLRCILSLLLVCAGSASAELELHNVERLELNNGLTVLLLEDRNFPVVSVQMVYKVGARNEVTGKTGLAHFVEHMAFRASRNFPDTEVVSKIYGAGGEWHGYTWIDQTTYFATVPKQELEMLLAIEADRMAHLLIDPGFIEAERGAVLAEMHMYENDPDSMLMDALLYASFLAHPYRNNTIGWESDIENVTHDDVVAFYQEHYHPANAVLAVVGDFDKATVSARIKSLFGDFEARAVSPLPHTREPLQQGERRTSIRGTTAGKRVLVAYRAPAVGDPDFAAFLVLQEILSGSSGVSFLQNDWGTPASPGSLLHGSIAGISSWYPPSEQPYLFVVGGYVEDDTSESAAEQAIEKGIATLRDEPTKRATVELAIDAVLDELVFDIQTTEDAAHQLASFAAMGALDELLALPQRIEAVSPADIMALAQTYLRPERRTIAWYRPGHGPAAHEPEVARVLAAPPAPAGNIDTSPVGPVEVRLLSGGIPALVIASDISPSVDLRLVVPGSGLEASGFASDTPVPGTSTWHGKERASRVETLVAKAARALREPGQAKKEPATLSADPETRLSEEFLALTLQPTTRAAPAMPAVVVLAGDVDTDRAFAILEDAFGGMNSGVIPKYARPAIPSGRKSVALGRPVAQSQLGYIVTAPGPSESGHLASRLLLYVLAHGYEGRLGKEAISNRGLAYYIDAQYTSVDDAAWITLSTGVDTSKIGKLENLLAAELARLKTEPPTIAEIEEGRQHLLGRAQSAAQSNDELTAELARHWLQYRREPSTMELETQLRAVTRDDVLAIIPAFVDGLTITVTP